jgi:hypothetical protein
MGPRVYIHEFVRITGHNRARYFQHITANWSPIGQAERGQRCFGIWGTVGSTARWPEVVNLWEYDGWDHLADNFRIEFDHPTLQDPSLADWWAAAEHLRTGGWDRVLVAADYSPGIDELTADGVRGHLYAHEIYDVNPGESPAVLDLLADLALPAYRAAGAELIGAFRTAMVDDREVIALWAFPDWTSWGRFESANDTDPAVRNWRERARRHVRRTHRSLLVDAPLSPLRTGRQPQESDRRPLD